MKIVVVGAGEVGKHALDALVKILPKDKKIDIVLLNRSLQKAEGSFMDLDEDRIFFYPTLKALKQS